MSDVHVYRNGIVCCSACAPADMPLAEVAAAVNRDNPTGISSLWQISDNEAFSGGEPHPGPCEQSPGRVHYLLEC